MKKLFTLISVAMLASSAFATPFKNLYAVAETVPTAAGAVYLDTKDGTDKAYVKEISTDYDVTANIKVVLGENGGGDDGALDGYRGKIGTYEVKAYVAPADGYEFVCFSSVDKSTDPNAVYTYAECYKPFTGATQQDRVYDWALYANASEGNLININNVDHLEDGNNGEGGVSRDECLVNGAWSETPDSYIYAIFREVGKEYPKLVSEATAINQVVSPGDEAAPAYTVSGQKATESTKGILIKDGKKYMNK